MDCLGEETVPVPGRSGARSSVASTRWQQFKEGVCWMWGGRGILPALLLTLDEYSSWRVRRVVPMICSEVRTTLCRLLRSDLVAELNQTVIEVQRTDSMMAELNCFSSSCGRLNFLSWRRKYNLCWAFLTMESMWLCTSGPGRWWCPGTWMTPLSLHCCPWWWVGGE